MGFKGDIVKAGATKANIWIYDDKIKVSSDI